MIRLFCLVIATTFVAASSIQEDNELPATNLNIQDKPFMNNDSITLGEFEQELGTHVILDDKKKQDTALSSVIITSEKAKEFLRRRHLTNGQGPYKWNTEGDQEQKGTNVLTALNTGNAWCKTGYYRQNPPKEWSQSAKSSGIIIINTRALVYLGDNSCTSSNKCSQCQGDCDNDNDCAPGLQCFQREKGENVPGCAAADVNKNADFCVDQGDDHCSEFSDCADHQFISTKGTQTSDRKCKPCSTCYKGTRVTTTCSHGNGYQDTKCSKCKFFSFFQLFARVAAEKASLHRNF